MFKSAEHINVPTGQAEAAQLAGSVDLLDVLSVDLIRDQLYAQLRPADVGSLRLASRAACTMLDACLRVLHIAPAALGRALLLDRMRHRKTCQLQDAGLTTPASTGDCGHSQVLSPDTGASDDPPSDAQLMQSGYAQPQSPNTHVYSSSVARALLRWPALEKAYVSTRGGELGAWIVHAVVQDVLLDDRRRGACRSGSKHSRVDGRDGQHAEAALPRLMHMLQRLHYGRESPTCGDWHIRRSPAPAPAPAPAAPQTSTANQPVSPAPPPPTPPLPSVANATSGSSQAAAAATAVSRVPARGPDDIEDMAFLMGSTHNRITAPAHGVPRGAAWAVLEATCELIMAGHTGLTHEVLDTLQASVAALVPPPVDEEERQSGAAARAVAAAAGVLIGPAVAGPSTQQPQNASVPAYEQVSLGRFELDGGGLMVSRSSCVDNSHSRWFEQQAAARTAIACCGALRELGLWLAYGSAHAARGVLAPPLYTHAAEGAAAGAAPTCSTGRPAASASASASASAALATAPEIALQQQLRAQAKAMRVDAMRIACLLHSCRHTTTFLSAAWEIAATVALLALHAPKPRSTTTHDEPIALAAAAAAAGAAELANEAIDEAAAALRAVQVHTYPKHCPAVFEHLEKAVKAASRTETVEALTALHGGSADAAAHAQQPRPQMASDMMVYGHPLLTVADVGRPHSTRLESGRVFAALVVACGGGDVEEALALAGEADELLRDDVERDEGLGRCDTWRHVLASQGWCVRTTAEDQGLRLMYRWLDAAGGLPDTESFAIMMEDMEEVMLVTNRHTQMSVVRGPWRPLPFLQPRPQTQPQPLALPQPFSQQQGHKGDNLPATATSSLAAAAASAAAAAAGAAAGTASQHNLHDDDGTEGTLAQHGGLEDSNSDSEDDDPDGDDGDWAGPGALLRGAGARNAAAGAPSVPWSSKQLRNELFAHIVAVHDDALVDDNALSLPAMMAVWEGEWTDGTDLRGAVAVWGMADVMTLQLGLPRAGSHLDPLWDDLVNSAYNGGMLVPGGAYRLMDAVHAGVGTGLRRSLPMEMLAGLRAMGEAVRATHSGVQYRGCFGTYYINDTGGEVATMLAAAAACVPGGLDAAAMYRLWPLPEGVAAPPSMSSAGAAGPSSSRTGADDTGDVDDGDDVNREEEGRDWKQALLMLATVSASGEGGSRGARVPATAVDKRSYPYWKPYATAVINTFLCLGSSCSSSSSGSSGAGGVSVPAAFALLRHAVCKEERALGVGPALTFAAMTAVARLVGHSTADGGGGDDALQLIPEQQQQQQQLVCDLAAGLHRFLVSDKQGFGEVCRSAKGVIEEGRPGGPGAGAGAGAGRMDPPTAWDDFMRRIAKVQIDSAAGQLGGGQWPELRDRLLAVCRLYRSAERYMAEQVIPDPDDMSAGDYDDEDEDDLMLFDDDDGGDIYHSDDDDDYYGLL